ncbi:hypothetical protein CFAL_08955 [Corynebacterium falsenii DSM 44353]|uniref:hypothetical protein n=1 Tax=Corynebacterium falsenii TaxID=108486 RepID=UPI0003E944A3|nr:hypothetical protein [Corynebacterium falsenii]AHI04350.1 hypothetical protein CFAL_08955 [Corynebacterium falsenii DSM 44353]UBI04441.1 hypothetical protein LA343_10795 [Corynebacterium falsenii]
MSDQGHAKRFVVGFAVIGLILAGIIGVWTWQATSKGSASSSNVSVTDDDLAESSPTTSSAKDTPSTSPSRQPSVSRTRPTDESTKNNVAPLGADPYLPPNSWGGTETGLAQPTATLVADAIDPNGTDTTGPTGQTGPTTAKPTSPNFIPPLPTQVPTQVPALPENVPNPGHNLGGMGSSDQSAQTTTAADHPLLDIIPPRWRAEAQQAPTDTTTDAPNQPAR